MVREWVSAHSTFEDAVRVSVLAGRAEVKHPVVLAMMVVKELLRVFPPVAVQALDAGRGVSHDDHFVSDVCEIYKSSAKWA